MDETQNKAIYYDRRSLRLKGYNYSQSGSYFITICTQKRKCLFGDILDGQMLLNDAGRMIEKWLYKLPGKFNGIELDEYIIMPNHIHCIIENIDLVGADPCVCPDNNANNNDIENRDMGEHTGSPLQKIMQWFKTMTTNEYIRNVELNGWESFDGKLWQRNYYEHVIRDDDDLDRIREYIANNPANWQEDENNPAIIKKTKR